MVEIDLQKNKLHYTCFAHKMSNQYWDRKWETSEKVIFVVCLLFTLFGGMAYYFYKEKQIRDDFLQKHSKEIMNLESIKKEQLEK